MQVSDVLSLQELVLELFSPDNICIALVSIAPSAVLYFRYETLLFKPFVIPFVWETV